MIFVILADAADKRELLLRDGGLCHFSQKKTGTVVIHEIIVLPSHRRKGVGAALVQKVRDMHPGSKMRALCPIDYPSNEFWKGIGCVHKGTKKNESGTVEMNIWEMDPEDEEAPPVVAPTVSVSLFPRKSVTLSPKRRLI